MNSSINSLGIDVKTKDAKRLVGRLKRLKSTLSVCDGGEYFFPNATGYSQVHIETSMTEEQLDNWLWRVKHGCEYVGVFVND